MISFSNIFHPQKWLYTIISGRTFTYSIWWRIISFTLLLGVLFIAFFLDYRLAYFHGCIAFLLMGVKFYQFVLSKTIKNKISDKEDISEIVKNGKKALVIGAGPCGLTAAKTLLQEGYDVLVLDRLDALGGKFSYIDPNLKLTSSKSLLSFSDYPIENDNQFINVRDYLEYLKRYAISFKVTDTIKYKSTIQKIRKIDDKFYRVTYQNHFGDLLDYDCDVVAVCTGLHQNKKKSSIANMDSNTSSKTNQNQIARNKKNVLVIGNGESSWGQIQKYIKSHTIQNIFVYLNKGFFPFPNELKKEYFQFSSIIGSNNTADVQTPPIFVYTWSHPWLLKSRLLYFLIDGIALPLYFSFLQPFGIKGGQKIMPKYGFPSSIQHFIMKTEIGNELGILGNSNPKVSKITYIHDITQIGVESNYILKTETESIEVVIDFIYDGTGYESTKFPFLSKKPMINVRHIIDKNEPQIAFIGFVRPAIGAIPPLAEAQTNWWLRIMDKDISNLSSEFYSMLPPSYKKDKKYGVHFDAYLCQLLKDMNAIPRIKDFIINPQLYISFMFAHAGAHMLRMYVTKSSKAAKNIALHEFTYNSLYASKNLWFIFLFLLMLSGIYVLLWLSIIIFILSPFIYLFKHHCIDIWNKFLKKYCATEIDLNFGSSKL